MLKEMSGAFNRYGLNFVIKTKGTEVKEIYKFTVYLCKTVHFKMFLWWVYKLK